MKVQPPSLLSAASLDPSLHLCLSDRTSGDKERSDQLKACISKHRNMNEHKFDDVNEFRHKRIFQA